MAIQVAGKYHLKEERLHGIEGVRYNT